MSKYRAWVFTINNYTDSDMVDVILLQEEAVYILAGFEVGEEGTPHIQGYVYFRSARYRKAISKLIPRARLEFAKGTPEHNYVYTGKEGNLWVWGEKPTQGRASREKIEEIMNNPYDNFHAYNQYRKCYKELKRSEKKTHERKLYLMSYCDRYINADEYPSHIFIPEEKYDLYEEEQVVTLDYDTTMRREVVDWKHGHPTRIRRGYEIIKFDPEIIFLMYSTPVQFEHLKKIYSNLIDEPNSEGRECEDSSETC